MESFYGGRTGAGMRITKIYDTFEDLKNDFALISCTVRPGEYALINPKVKDAKGTIYSDILDRYHPEYGDIYRRELDYTPTKCGNIAGPQGPASIMRLAGYAINIPTNISWDAGWSPTASTILLRGYGIGDAQSANSIGVCYGDGTNLKTINGMINWLNKNFPREKIWNNMDLRGATVSIGYAGDDKAMAAVNNSANPYAKWPRRYFIHDFSHYPHEVYYDTMEDFPKQGDPNLVYISKETPTVTYKWKLDINTNTYHYMADDTVERDPLGTWVYAGQLNILTATNVNGYLGYQLENTEAGDRDVTVADGNSDRRTIQDLMDIGGTAYVTTREPKNDILTARLEPLITIRQ